MSVPNLSPDAWARAKAVLLGEGKKVSLYSAAKAAGVTLREFDAWINRSRARHDDDDPWVYEIAETVDDSPVAQAGVLEDVAWDHVLNGVEKGVYHQGQLVATEKEYDHRLLERMLKARDERYVEKNRNVNVNVNADIDINVLEQKWEVFQRMKDVRSDSVLDEEGRVVIEHTERTGMNQIATELASERVKLLEEIDDPPDLSEFDF